MVRVNLIPISVQAGQAQAARLRRWGVGVTLAVVVLAAPLLADQVRQARLAKLSVRYEQLQAERTSLQAEVRRVTEEAHQAALHIERARALRAKRGWSRLLSLVMAAMPESCSLQTLSTDPPAPTGGAVRAAVRSMPVADGGSVMIEAPRRLRINGLASGADEPHEFVANLRNLGVFRDVVLEHARAEPTANGSLLRFELSCEW